MISVIIPVHNGEQFIKDCLDALCFSENTCEIIVIDDASSDNTYKICSSFKIKLLQNKEQKGASASRNIGAAHAIGDILLFIDADVVVRPDTLNKVSIFFTDNPGVSAVFGSYDDAPAAKNFFSQYKNLTHHFFHQSGTRDTQTFWTGCGAVRRTAFVEIEGFNENQNYMEDIELGYRLRSQGYQIFLFPELQVKHLKKWTFSSMLYTDIFCRAIPWAKLLLKNPDITHGLNLQTSQKISALFTILIPLTLIFSVFEPALSIISLISFIIIVIINHRYYYFFLRNKGIWFTIWVIPFHLLYFCYSSAIFFWVWLKSKTERMYKIIFFKSKQVSYN